MMNEFIKSKRNYLLSLAILFVIVTLSGPTYSLFIKNDTTEDFNYNTGLLDLTFKEDKPIVLTSAFPQIDSEGEKTSPYSLTIKNIGNLTYKFDLKMVSQNVDNSINPNYIKVKVNNQLPQLLSQNNGIISKDMIIKPNEELTFNIKIWLDSNTPNTELGKNFTARINTNGTAIYKTLDNSGANHPVLKNNMIPIYYDEIDKVWRKADYTNNDQKHKWYNYDEAMWANVAVLKNSDKLIYDITNNNNNLTIKNNSIDNGNIIIERDALDIGLSNYQYNVISSIIKLKINKLSNKIYLLNNNKITYYYDTFKNKFIFSNGVNEVPSSSYQLIENTDYDLGFTYDGYNISFYVNGELISTNKISGNISSSDSFKVGEKNTSITISDLYVSNKILSSTDFASYHESNKINYDNMLEGYNEFTPMTILEYYQNADNGTIINDSNIDSYFVWIPRFKYKLWNVTGEKGIDAYNALDKGIDISFEKDEETSGTIHCKENKCYSDPSMTIATTKKDNNKYYTHPAFKYYDKNLKGIWVSKYELSNINDNLESKPTNSVWTNQDLIDFYNKTNNLENNYSIIKNSEWGAVAYLSHSKYGTCQNYTCQKTTSNNKQISGNDIFDTTTNNIYGIFDMMGSAREITMAHYIEKTQGLPNNITLGNILINHNDIDLYYENTFILGDATKEINDKLLFNPENSWLIRENNNIFDYQISNENKNPNVTTRIVQK